VGDDSAGFGPLLRASRISAGLSQQELADASGMSVRAISDLERGRTLRPYPDSLNRLATALALDGQARAEFIAAAGRRLGPALSGDSERPGPLDQPAVLVPRQLPAPASQFVGRKTELASLTQLLERAADAQATMVISAIGGTAGVGKTALAVRWAHRVAGSFPDGQLYVNLRGYDVDRPVLPADALAGFLRALGMAGQDIPVDAEERAGIYRSLVAGRRMLILLDNANREDQVRPLLPGTPSCTVLVTSRNALRGLVARDGATRLELDLLPMPGAVALLRELIGERVDADKDAAATLAAQCSRLPLALRVAAELASARPGVPLAQLTAELADSQHRLDQLDAGGDPRTEVRAVFSWSYGTLDHDAARFFRLAGLHPGPDLDDYAAAAISQAGLHDARRLLDQLTRASLMQRTGPGRHGMHDLLRAYARELADGDEAARHAALTTMFDYYLHTAATAMDVLYPAESERRPRVPRPASPIPPLAGEAAALEWLDAERANLVIIAGYAADNDGWRQYAILLAATLYRYLDAFAHYGEAMAILSSARRAARQAGDVGAEARSLISLAAIDHRFEQYAQAARYLRQALALCQTAGDRAGEARALGNLGLIDINEGRYRQAVRHLRQALAYFREAGDRPSEARALGNLAFVDVNQGRYRQAERRLRQALALFHAAGDRGGETETLSTLGVVALREGSYELAASHLEHALAGWRDIGFRLGEAEVLMHLGVVALRQGDHTGAASRFELSLALWREFGNRRGEAGSLNGLGDVALADGRPDVARIHYAQALTLAAEVSSKDEEGRAYDGLGQADHASGDEDAAKRHWQQALAIFAALGAPEADEIRTRLGLGLGGDAAGAPFPAESQLPSPALAPPPRPRAPATCSM
jgi:tetratricopeptide (TPR) repeat protein/transcriptional regulator with XRE-family HTH domain